MRLVVLVALALAGCAEQRTPTFIPLTHRDGDRVVMPLAFPDGTRVTLTYPPELAIAEMGVRPYGSATLGRIRRDFLIVYGTGDEPHLRHALRVEFDRWTVEVYDYPSGPDAMTDAERLRFQASLHGRETADGFLLLEATSPLTLARAGDNAGPALEFGMSRDSSPWLMLVPGHCRPIAASKKRDYSHWCLSDSLRIHAYGDRRFRAAAAEGIQLR